MRFLPIWVTLISMFLASCKSNDVQVLPISIQITEAHSLESIGRNNFITNFEFDQSGVLWVGTFSDGIHRISDGTTEVFNINNSALPGNFITDIFIDELNTVWVGTNGGFASYEEGVWLSFTMENTPLFVDHVRQIARYNDQLLIGNGSATFGGLVMYHNGAWQNFTLQNSDLPCAFINEIEVDEDGNFWVATSQVFGNGGLLKIRDGVIEEVFNNQNSGLLYNSPSEIEVSKERAWVGYLAQHYNQPAIADGGLQLLNVEGKTKQDFFPNETAFISNRISAMKLAKDGSLWFATASLDGPFCQNCDSGIGVYLPNGRIVTFNDVNDEFNDNYLGHLSEDESGNIFLSTQNKLYHLSFPQ